MWPFKRQPDVERERDRQMYLESLKVMEKMVEQQSQAIQQLFSIFQVTGLPESRVMTDEEELALELERRRNAAAMKWQGES